MGADDVRTGEYADGYRLSDSECGGACKRYISALEQQRYIKGTNILEPEAFLALVKAYLNARDKGLTQCALLSVDTKENDRDEVGKRLIKLLRQSDMSVNLKVEKCMRFLQIPVQKMRPW